MRALILILAFFRLFALSLGDSYFLDASCIGTPDVPGPNRPTSAQWNAVFAQVVQFARAANIGLTRLIANPAATDAVSVQSRALFELFFQNPITVAGLQRVQGVLILQSKC